MRKLIFLAILIACSAPMAFAQTSDEYNKVEVSGGYSHARVDTGADEADFDDDFGDFLRDRRGFNGFDASIAGNFHKYVGAKFNVSGHYKSDNFTFDDGVDLFRVDTKERLYNFLGGVQFKDNRKESKVKPFAHVLAGVAHQSVEFSSPDAIDNFDISDTSFAMKFGGGVDVRVHPRVDLRVVEVNYNPVFIGDRDVLGETFQGSTQHNFTIGFGIAIH